MSRVYALIANGVVANVILAESWHNGVDVTDLVPRPAPRWTYDGTSFAPPVQPEPAPQTTTILSKLAFLRRVPAQVRIAIRQARATNPIIEDAEALMQLADNIDVTDSDTIGYVGYLQSQGFITAEQAAAWLAPEPAASGA